MNLFWSVVVNLGSKTHFKYIFLLYLYILDPPKMSGNNVFCPGSGKFGLGSKIFGLYCPRAVRFLTDLSQPDFSANFGKTVLWSFMFYSLYESLKK